MGTTKNVWCVPIRAGHVKRIIKPGAPRISAVSGEGAALLRGLVRRGRLPIPTLGVSVSTVKALVPYSVVNTAKEVKCLVPAERKAGTSLNLLHLGVLVRVRMLASIRRER